MNSHSLENRILTEARSWIGTPYIHQATSKGHGADCLGLIRGIWRTLYGNEPQSIPDYTRDWDEVGRDEHLLAAANRWFEWMEPDHAQPGNLIVFRWKGSAVAKHVGILSGIDRFIHAYERSGVIETTLAPQWRRRIAGYFRFPSDTLTRS